jgi:hypothetical protein
MDDETIIKRIQVISEKHGWKDTDAISADEVESRLLTVSKEDPELGKYLFEKISAEPEKETP